jgi:hypothetical protein
MCSKAFVFMAGLCLTISARAQTSINIPDYSFEGITTSLASPNGLSVATNTGPIGAWSAFAAGLVGLNSSIASGTASSLGAPAGADGSYVAQITLPVGAGASAGLRQTLTDTFLPNSLYTLSFQLDGGTSVSLLAGSSLSLENNSTPVASLSGANLVALLDGNGDFQTITLTYQTGNTPPSGNIGIEFDAGSVAGVGGSIYFDNFQLNAAPVPEPQTVALVVMGSLLVFGFSKHRTRKQG